MILQYRHFDRKAVVACSGGPDSMVLLDFLLKKKKVDCVVYVNHLTNSEYAKHCIDTIERFVDGRVPIFIRSIQKVKSESSLEEQWREQRIKILRCIAIQRGINIVVTGHNLNDATEFWIMSSCNGQPRLIPRCTDFDGIKFFKPLLHTSRENIENWCLSYQIPFVIDQSNNDTVGRFDRVKVRHNVLPELLKIYPGLMNMVRKKSLKEEGKI